MARPLRLLIASQPLTGGVAAHVLDLVEALPRDEFTVDVACPPESEVWAGLEGRDHVTLHRIGSRRRPAPGDARSLVALMRLIRQVDVVHVHSAKAGFVGRLAAALDGRRQRCVFTPHAWSFWAVDGAEARLYTRLERLAAHWCGAIVALSDDERAAGLAAGVGRPEQYRVIPNGIHVDRYAATPRPVPGRLLVVGRFARQKRPDVAIRAFALAAERFPDAELHFAGDGDGRDEAERLAAELGLGDRVRFLGSRDDVPELLREAAALVLASSYEGSPLVVIEAMAAGVPVLATGAGGLDELVENGRTGLLAADTEELGAGMIELLTNPDRALAMGMAGRAIARDRLSHGTMIARLSALYGEVGKR